MMREKTAYYFSYLLVLLFLFAGCKTAQITYLGFINTRYPRQAPINKGDTLKGPGTRQIAGAVKSDTIAMAIVELLGDEISNASPEQVSTEKSYFDTLYPEKYKIIVRKTSDTTRITTFHSLEPPLAREIKPDKTEPEHIFLQGYVYQGNFNTPSKNNFLILATIPSKKSAYTNSSGYFEFGKINLSDLSLMVFDKSTWSFIEIPLRLKNLSSFNQIKILLTAR